jgi:Domain of unknown function (DUF222)/HNH endonuclease
MEAASMVKRVEEPATRRRDPHTAPVRAALAFASSDVVRGLSRDPVDAMNHWITVLAEAHPGPDDAALIDQLRAAENLKAAAAAFQAQAAVALDVSQRRAQVAAGLPAAEVGKGVAAQIALARRESPARGNRLLGMAKALVTEMPHTLAALTSGTLNEWRATLLVRETACLSASDRCALDEELAPDTGTFDGAGDARIVGQARRVAYRLDPHSVVERARKAEADRFVSLRPAPDTMTYLTALLPVTAGVAAYAALRQDAEGRRNAGDERGIGQLMADTLVENVTGTPGGCTRLEVQLIMTDRTLLQGDSEPAQLPGYGVVPAQWARDRLTPAKQPATTQTTSISGTGAYDVWLRRLYTAPAEGQLVGMDSIARAFPEGLRSFIQARDTTCRTPYCDAPIRHRDHVVPWHRGGETTGANGAGLCEACNQLKEAPGWTAQPRPGPRHTIEYRTPTGHTYRSIAPPLPGTTARACNVATKARLGPLAWNTGVHA